MSTMPAPQINCWSQIGSNGDRSCPELPQWSVCSHCPVFVRHSQTLFDHTPPAGYLEHWAEVLAQPARETGSGIESLVVFEVAGECLGLRSSAFLRIDEYRRPRPVPHRTNEVFLGLVAVEGRIHLCVDLGRLLGIPWSNPGSQRRPWSKLMILEVAGESLAVPVVEILGAFHFDSATSQPPPFPLQKAVPTFTTHIFRLKDRPVGVLDAQKILDHVTRSVLA